MLIDQFAACLPDGIAGGEHGHRPDRGHQATRRPDAVTAQAQHADGQHRKHHHHEAVGGILVGLERRIGNDLLDTLLAKLLLN